MNFIDFTNNRFQELNAKSNPNQFSAFIECESRALQTSVRVLFFLFGVALVPKILIHFLAVNLRLASKPEPVLDNLQRTMNQMKSQEEDKRISKLGKKYGFNTVRATNEPA